MQHGAWGPVSGLRSSGARRWFPAIARVMRARNVATHSGADAISGRNGAWHYSKSSACGSCRYRAARIRRTGPLLIDDLRVAEIEHALAADRRRRLADR